jgi:hypothetical protein
MSRTAHPHRLWFSAFAVAFLFHPAATCGDQFRVVVRGGDDDLPETPVMVQLAVPVPEGFHLLQQGGAGRPILAQVFLDGKNRWLATITQPLKRHEARVYQGDSAPQVIGTDAPRISFVRQAHNLAVYRDNQLFTELVVDAAANKPFFFPLIGPTGASYTRAFPMRNVPGEDKDHPHQKSWWFTHGNVNGVDFWSEGPSFGKIRQSELHEIVAGPVLGRIRTRNDWISQDGRTVCDDERVVTFYRSEPARVVDFEITLRASSGPVTFRDTKEGTFGLRVASSMDVDKHTGGRITNADGLHDERAWGQASAWVDYVGPLDGKVVGIAVLNHPTSFRFPTTWHVRPYGLFAANPFGWHDFGRRERGDFTIAADHSITFRYRVILHEGETSALGLPQIFRAYANPPTLEVELRP